MENLFILKCRTIIEKIMYNQSFRNFRAKTRYRYYMEVRKISKKDDMCDVICQLQAYKWLYLFEK